MKKFFALLLVALLVMSMSAALAAVDTSTWTSTAYKITPTQEQQGILKVYTSDTVDLPDETLSFTCAPDSSNPDTTNISISDLPIVSGTEEYNLEINVPSYSKVGIYKYSITEDEGETQGVTYATNTVSLSVLVVYDYENECLKVEKIGVTLPEGETEKEDTFTNEFTTGGDRQNGSLKVKKTVTGNLGDKSKDFEIYVTLKVQDGKKVYTPISVSGGSNDANTQTIAGNGWTEKKITIVLKDDETVTIDKIPTGMTYTVEESDEYSQETDLNKENSYDAPVYANEEGSIAKGTTPLATVTNNKEGSINTGVILQYAPYIAILAVVLAGAALMIIRRRRNSED